MKNSPSPALLRQHIQSSPKLKAALVLTLIALVSSLPFYSFAQADVVPVKKSRPAYSVARDKGSFVLYAGPNGEVLCRQATPNEAREISGASSRGLVQINHLGKEESAEAATGLTILLQATSRLAANATARDAFIAAAAKWEQLIKDPITVIVAVDLGPTFFDEPTPFEGDEVGLTSSPLFRGVGNYPSWRNRIINHASASEAPIAGALPAAAIPTDRGSVNTLLAGSPLLRALGVFPANVANDDPNDDIPVPRIGFNSAFPFDFNPNDGISGTDFDAVAVHEIGHVLGFDSAVGEPLDADFNVVTISIWDLFRFRPGTANLNNFSTASRVLSAGGGEQVQFNGGPELGLSTGKASDGSGGDGRQGSHWRDNTLNADIFIGIMDPTIPNNFRETMQDNDRNAIDAFGYNITNAPAPPNDNFANAQLVTGHSGSVTGTNLFSTKEPGEPTHDPAPQPPYSGKSIWYRWTAPSSGTVTMTTAGSTYDTLLAVYTGSAVNGLTLIDRNDDENNPGGIVTSRVQFPAVAGTTYQITVDGWASQDGSVAFNWTLPGGATPTPTPTPQPNTVQFSSSTASANELDGSTAKAVLTVTRTGTTTAAASVNYATTDATASERSDYLAALGTLRFAANETTKTITVFVVNDSFGEGPEAFNITLSAPVGCTVGSPAASVVTINSDEPTSGVHGPNPVKDPTFSSDNFVRQQYVDFFNREADSGGLNFWKNQIDECTTQDCRNIRRTNVSAAFFVSIEFQETGYLVYKAYQAAFSFGEFLKLRDFLPDTQEIGRGVVIGAPGAEAQLEANKVAFFNDFVQRPTFVAAANYPTTMSAVAFVDKLNANTFDPRNTGSGGALTPAQRDALIAELTPNPSSAALRASVLRQVAENSVFSTRQFNKAFVLMQYFGYLRRNPNDAPEFGLDFGGYNFWLGKLNQFNGNYIAAQMVEAFITAGEYKLRFGPD